MSDCQSASGPSGDSTGRATVVSLRWAIIIDATRSREGARRKMSNLREGPMRFYLDPTLCDPKSFARRSGVYFRPSVTPWLTVRVLHAGWPRRVN